MKSISSLTLTYNVTPDMCGKTMYTYPLSAFTLFQALATVHAEKIGVGSKMITEKQLFWVAVHTRIEFYSAAPLATEIKVTTWPEETKGKSIRTCRSYLMKQKNKIIAKGKTEWVVLGKDGKIKQYYLTGFPEDFPYLDKTALNTKFQRFTTDYSSNDFSYEHTVKSTDTDFAGHMNNVTYAKLALNCFTAEEISEDKVKAMEIRYATPCYENEKISLYKTKEIDNKYKIVIVKQTGETAAVCSVEF